MKQIVLASDNRGKLKEFQLLLTPFDIDVIPQAVFGVPSIPETGLSFVENAILKARHAAEATGLPSLADDSGLTVSALKGAPGIYSARYAGEHASSADCITKVLQDVQAIPDATRDAAFYCVLVFMLSPIDPNPLICEGVWQGSLLEKPQGGSGFGYDPIFFVPGENKSAAELTPECKNRISHRGQAVQRLLSLLPSKLI